jgi:hypothetical protein
MEVDVYELRCPQCIECTPYDGLEAGIYNFSNETLFTEDVCKTFYTDVCKKPMTTKNGFHKTMMDKYGVSGYTCVSEKTLNDAIVAYLTVVKTNYEQGMICPICSALPAKKQTLLIDGLWMGMSKKNMLAPVKYPYTNTILPNINKNKYRIIQDQYTRELLKGYIKKEEGLQPDQMAALTTRLSGNSLLEFFQYARSFEGANVRCCPPAFKKFLGALASNSNGLVLAHREAMVSRKLNYNANGAALSMLESWITHCTPDNKLTMEAKEEIYFHFSSLSALLGECGLEYIPTQFHAVLVSLLVVSW